MSLSSISQPQLAGAGAAAAGLGALSLWLLARRKPMLSGTTLVAAWWWAVFSLAALTAVELAVHGLGAKSSPAWASQGRFLAATTTFGPLMAALGAKRPQDRAWQFIVLALLVVLMLPGLEALAFRPDKVLHLHPARRAFLLILVLAGLLNWLPTRGWLTALLIAAGQAALFLDHLPLMATMAHRLPADARQLLAGLLLAAGIGVWSFLRPPRRPDASPLDAAWLDFRDSFGAVWALRVAERVNSAAAMCGWNVRLRWTGFSGASGTTGPELAPETAAALRDSFRTLLRRFVNFENL